MLRLYAVHPRLIALLEDLHTGTTASVRLGGRVGPAFGVTAGVRQGCVVAPMLFNIFLDHVVREAMDRMPANCGVALHVYRRHSGHALHQPAPHGTAGAAASSMERILLLMYADDMVLLSNDPKELATKIGRAHV